MGLSASDRALAAVPLSHVTGVIALIAAMTRAAAALDCDAELQGPRILRPCCARGHDALADGSSDVQLVPARAQLLPKPTLRPGASAATAAHRWRRRPSPGLPRSCRTSS